MGGNQTLPLYVINHSYASLSFTNGYYENMDKSSLNVCPYASLYPGVKSLSVIDKLYEAMAMRFIEYPSLYIHSIVTCHYHLLTSNMSKKDIKLTKCLSLSTFISH